MMAVEGPFLSAVIARLPDPTYNLAAYGVSFAFAILVEAPVIMLMSASTALVEDRDSYLKLRNFTRLLNTGATVLLLVVLIPGVYHLIMQTVIGLPEPVAELVRGSLWLLLPWPAAIGYRRFLHGLLIRSGRTRLVAVGTVLRILGMALTAVLLFSLTGLPGALVGAGALSAGVCTEALAARFMAAGTVAELKAGGPLGRPSSEVADHPSERAASGDATIPAGTLSYREITSFYWPLALTSLIGLTVQPMLTFFMGRAHLPIVSLAVFPVVHALSFLFRALGLSFQEAAIALLGPRGEHAAVVGRFGLLLGVAASAGLGLVAFTPLADFWFITVSGLTPELAGHAIVPTMLLVPLPGLTVLMSYQRAVLVQGRRTGFVTGATVVEVVLIGLLFAALGWGWGLVGVTAAFAAFVGGRLAANGYLVRPVTRTLARLRPEGG